ncbi:MAG: hypothetical protein ACYST6_20365 [Planctomycetota bacterium]
MSNCSGRYATAQEYSDFWCTCQDLTADQISDIEFRLDLTASRIHMALISQNACDCTLADGAAEWLKLLNIIFTGALNQCPCGNAGLSDEEQANLIEWAENQLSMLQSGELTVCQGDTGSQYPAIGIAEVNYGSNERQIIINDIMRNRT